MNKQRPSAGQDERRTEEQEQLWKHFQIDDSFPKIIFLR